MEPEVAVYPLLSGGVELTLAVYHTLGQPERVSVSTNLTSSEIGSILRRVADKIDPQYDED